MTTSSSQHGQSAFLSRFAREKNSRRRFSAWSYLWGKLDRLIVSHAIRLTSKTFFKFVESSRLLNCSKWNWMPKCPDGNIWGGDMTSCFCVMKGKNGKQAS